MNMKALLISVVLVSIILLGSMDYLNGLSQGYTQSINLSQLDNTRARLDTHRGLVEEISNKTQSLKFEGTASLLFYAPYEMMKIGWNSILLMLNSLTTGFAIIGDLVNILSTNGLGLPSWFIPSIIAIVTILIIILLVELFFRWKME